MISQSPEDFAARTSHLAPIVTPALYPKLVLLDNFIKAGFEYLDLKAQSENAQFLRAGEGKAREPVYRDRARWLNDYRTLTVGVGREGATQAYVTLELSPISTLVVFNNTPRPREIMLANMAQLSQEGLRMYSAEWFEHHALPLGGEPISTLVFYEDSEHEGVNFRELLTKLLIHIYNPDTVRILVIKTA